VIVFLGKTVSQLEQKSVPERINHNRRDGRRFAVIATMIIAAASSA
jgi:hypothetical protein